MKSFTISGRPSPYQFRQWRSERYADFDSGLVVANKRVARCRLCGKQLPKGEGIGYIELMNDGYRMNDKYVCVSCEQETKP